MSTATVRGGFDTFAGSANPSLEHGDDKYLKVSDGAQYAYLYLKNPAPRGATIVSATLRVKARGASTGARTLTVRRVADSWKASKLNWNNKPGVTGVAKTAAVGTLADGDVVEFDVTGHVQNVVNGSAHYGWRLETTAATSHRFYGFDAGDNKPTLEVVWADKPGVPTSLSPAGGKVSLAKPVLAFDYADVTGEDLVAVQVHIDPAANGSSPAFDSGEVAATEPELDLSQTAYAGLAGGATTQWRARVKDAGGLWSEWSDWVSFGRDVKGTLTIDNPAADPNDFVSEPTPPIFWTLTGETQVAWQLRITRGDDRSVILYDTGKRKGAENSHTLPKLRGNGNRLLVDDRTYQVNVRAWDGKDRVRTAGDPVFTYEWRTFTMNDDPTVNKPTGLIATQEGTTPWVILEFDRATAPDSFVVLRKGPNDDKAQVVESGLDPVDLFVSGTTYRWRDHGAKPYTTETYTVKAVVNGKASPPSTSAEVKTQPAGVWIIDYDRDLSFKLSGLDVDDWRMVDQGVDYQPLGSEVSARIVQGLNGLEGSFTGMLKSTEERGVGSFENHLWKIKERPTERVRLVAGDLSIPVKLADLSCSPHPKTLPGNLRYLVSFRFRQVGALPFEARV